MTILQTTKEINIIAMAQTNIVNRQLPQFVYEMRYCDCTYESALVTISLHRTKFGALRAMLMHKREIQARWDERRFSYGKRFNRGALPFNAMAWDIIETEIQE